MKLMTKTESEFIGRPTFDDKVMYVGCRIPTAVIRAKAIGLPVAKMPQMHAGFLLVHGDKPGILVHRVMWDESDVYRRDNKFGSLKALNLAKPKTYHAEIVSLDELRKRALKFNQVVKCRKVADNTLHEVALLNSFGDLYVSGIEPVKGSFDILNMEHPAAYNDKKVQFVDFVETKTSIRKFLRF